MNDGISDAFDTNPTPTFDDILPTVKEWLDRGGALWVGMLEGENDWLLVNRDLNGRVRLILPEHIRASSHAPQGDGTTDARWHALASVLMKALGVHGYSDTAAILFEATRDKACQGASHFPVEGHSKVWVVDRLASEGSWSTLAAGSGTVPRVVFFSIKGGVGRSTALAATAWSLAQAGLRVLVLDLDLESPGLSSALLPPRRQPKYGITDWLVEDLLNNADAVFHDIMSTSELSHDGDIHVVPAHGANHGEYIAKLGRVWMPKLGADGTREKWPARLCRLLEQLEAQVRPDVVLIDSRSGLDDLSSACITELGATLILLFALDGEQTWNGYRILFEHWRRAHGAEAIRERLKIVGAVVPELDRKAYLQNVREAAYGIFVESLYDEIAPANPAAIGPFVQGDGRWRVDDLVEGWSFDEADAGAPHHPWAVNWHRSFAGLRSLQGRLATIDAEEVKAIFGQLIDGVRDAVVPRNTQ